MFEMNYDYPLVVEITMYRHNLTDNRIISEIRKNARLNKVNSSNSHFFVSISDIKEVLNAFDDDIMYQSGLPKDKLVSDVNSAFFLHNVVNTFQNLRFVKFNISSKKNYSRKSGQTVSFDYKVLHARIDLPQLVKNKKELKGYQKLLIKSGLWKFDKYTPKPYLEIDAQTLIIHLQNLEASGIEFVKEFGEVHQRLINYIDVKLESDNSMLHLILLD